MQGATSFLCAMFLASAAQADAFSDSRGIWMRDDGNAKVSITQCGQQLCATNLWIGDTSKGEQAGDKLIMTLKPASQGTLTGKAYDPKRNRTYSMMLKVTNGGLTTRGCMAAGLICRNVRWTPAN
ncbi:DUF2147 domain-containing protein [Mesorhizobium hawassense]|uniref:DUF2147 domain-containing protein n=1 Tax=Mesorhizobium hawassense TaxID=1209954 RepID=A0A330I0K4_9HYPH|nr:DUF2147 domain-containing protein [Mesorhizobium hawassense]RAZ90517.1 DUF2147 domain-containing protein [Mesorhizobium hawassense]